jgi:hypothetical protein
MGIRNFNNVIFVAKPFRAVADMLYMQLLTIEIQVL